MFEADFTSDAAVELALHKFRDSFGSRIASVIHLVAYFDFTGEDNPALPIRQCRGHAAPAARAAALRSRTIRLCEHDARARAVPPWRAHRRAPADRSALGLSEIEGRRRSGDPRGAQADPLRHSAAGRGLRRALDGADDGPADGTHLRARLPELLLLRQHVGRSGDASPRRHARSVPPRRRPPRCAAARNRAADRRARRDRL